MRYFTTKTDHKKNLLSCRWSLLLNCWFAEPFGILIDLFHCFHGNLKGIYLNLINIKVGTTTSSWFIKHSIGSQYKSIVNLSNINKSIDKLSKSSRALPTTQCASMTENIRVWKWKFNNPHQIPTVCQCRTGRTSPIVNRIGIKLFPDSVRQKRTAAVLVGGCAPHYVSWPFQYSCPGKLLI